MREAGVPESGQTILHDGMTGDSFDQEVTDVYDGPLAGFTEIVTDMISIGPSEMCAGI